ncbi:MAG: hypothetical protein PHU70_06570 [Dehalococcoidia bacterium]|nr:hypothetical protein [Dehalococcoidia bacterium]
MELRPYQLEIARAVLESIEDQRGLTLSVEIARQGGKNELSAHIGVLLLTMFMLRGGSAVKCSPTFKPQTVISMMRLKQRLDDFGFRGLWEAEMGYIIRLGAACQVFLSAEETSSVVGHTADILLEIDESQDVGKDKYTRDFRPMASSTNATTVHYGTPWDDSTLLEEVKLMNLELEKKDGLKRHFRFDWQEVARYNPAYRAFVDAERARLGADHPLFLSQYALLPVRNTGGFLSRAQIAMLQGTHDRQARRESESKVYVAGLDLAGEAEVTDEPGMMLRGRDAAVLTIAEVANRADDSAMDGTSIEVVEHYCWTGRKHPELYRELAHILKHTWRCSSVVADATGVGEGVASFLRTSLGGCVVPFKFTQSSKSALGFSLLAAVNSGRLKLYRADGSRDYLEMMFEFERARSVSRPNRTINFFVEPSAGHDDYLISLALCVEAAARLVPRRAEGIVRE